MAIAQTVSSCKNIPQYVLPVDTGVVYSQFFNAKRSKTVVLV